MRIGDSAINDKAKLEETRLKMKGLLEVACESGGLNDALANVLPKARQEYRGETQDLDRQWESMKQDMSALLLKSSTSGRLEKALQSIAPQKESDWEDLQASMRRNLAIASKSGALSEAFGTIVVPRAEEISQKAQDVIQRPLSAGSSQRLVEGLSKDMSSVRQDQESLHRVVDQLSLQMEELRKENKMLMDRLSKKIPELGEVGLG